MTLKIIHFNDVYHMERAPRFSTQFLDAQKMNPEALVIFSGDVYSPSKESAMVKGEHMVPILNHLNIDIAMFGNHDFDFGVDVLTHLSLQNNFPWLLSNLKIGSKLNENPSNSKDFHILHQGGTKIGFIGLAGKEHADVRLLASIPFVLQDPVKVTNKLCAFLKQEHNVDFIVALTHMRVPEEMRLIEMCPDVDLYLGGHDHDYLLLGDYTESGNIANGTIKLVKSGSDFEQFSVIEYRSRDDVTVTRHDILKNTKEDTELVKKLEPMNNFISTLLEKKVMYTTEALLGTAVALRNMETNLGNLIADTYKAYFDVDIALVNAGAVRCDRTIPPGVLQLSDLIDIMPFQNPIFIKIASGKIIKEALENGYRDSRVDGRFLQISGLILVVDYGNREGSRITSIGFENGNVFDEGVEYRFAVSSFLCAGGDGFLMMKGLKDGTEGDEGISETEIMLSVFGDLEIKTDLNAMRARKVVIKGIQKGLPVVSPIQDGRIRLV